MDSMWADMPISGSTHVDEQLNDAVYTMWMEWLMDEDQTSTLPLVG